MSNCNQVAHSRSAALQEQDLNQQGSLGSIAFLLPRLVLQDGHRLRNLPLSEDEEEGSSRFPEGASADRSRGLKPIPEDAMRLSIEASNGAGGAPDARALPSEAVSLLLLY